MEKNEEMLEHHGIKGQKWGVRRYQKEDGTLTAAGKKRYSEQIADNIKGRLKESAKKQTEKLNHEIRMRTDPMYRYKNTKQPWDEKPSDKQPWDEKPSDRSKHLSSNTKSDKKVSDMSDAELRSRLNRLQMEKQYDQLTNSDISKGKKFVSDAIKAATTVATVSTTAITIYNNYGKIKKIVEEMTKK